MPARMTLQRWFLRMQYELGLRLIAGGDGLDRELTAAEVTRPGLALAGYFEHFQPERIQVFGQQEIAYLGELSSDRRHHLFRELLSRQVPCVVIARGLPAPEELIALSGSYRVPVFSTPMETASFIARAIIYLEEEFGEERILHANLVEIYGIGVLICGKSGIGKSECTLELIQRGHRFVADDSVLVKRLPGHRLIGTAAHALKHYMEVRGIGIIDVMTLFGISAVRNYKRIGLVATLEPWDAETDEVRTGLEEEIYMLLGEKLPHVRIPVRPGRSPAVIVEVATMDWLARRMGHYAAREYNEALLRQIEANQVWTSPEIDVWDDQIDF